MTLTERVARAICAHYETDIDKHWPGFEAQADDAIAAVQRHHAEFLSTHGPMKVERTA